MLYKVKNRKQEGFTIIEVLIVLAIAGLILLIVFLAVPALQRNSRNTQRKNDVQSLLGAEQEYVNNNGGKLPASQANVDAVYALAQFGYYNSGAPTYKNGAFVNPKDDKLYLAVSAKCGSGASLGDAIAGTSSRQVAVLYTSEDASGATKGCQDS